MKQTDETDKLIIPFKKTNKNATLPIISKKGDAGADARISGFKQIVNENGKKELIELDTETYTLKPLERIGCPLGFATAILVIETNGWLLLLTFQIKKFN
jgi:dUTPase